MAKLLQLIRQHECLYDAGMVSTGEEQATAWRTVARSMCYSVPRAQHRWKMYLKQYVDHLANPSHDFPLWLEMAFVRDHASDLLKQFADIPTTSNGYESDTDSSTVVKRARRPEIDGFDLMKTELERDYLARESQTNTLATSDCERILRNSTVPPVTEYIISVPDRTDSRMASVGSKDTHHTMDPENVPTIAVDNHQLSQGQIVSHSGLPPDLYQFGMLTATTLQKFSTKKQIQLKSVLFNILNNAEHEELT